VTEYLDLKNIFRCQRTTPHCWPTITSIVATRRVTAVSISRLHCA
jgi:hypothetical protein